MAAETAGVATVSVVETGFLPIAHAISKTLGAELPIAEYPGRFKNDSVQEQRAKMQGPVADAILRGLLVQPEVLAKTSEPELREVVFRGTLGEVDDHFMQNLW